MSFSPTPLRISTITALCNIGCEVPLQVLYDNIEINNVIQFIHFKDFPNKGVPKKTKRKSSKKSFYNQLTLILRLSEKRSINIKIFKNGQLQMTGVKSTEEGNHAVVLLIEELRTVLPEEYVLTKNGYRTVLINSDFCIGYKVNRNKLYLLLDQHYGMYVSYEPCIYPGVNAKYFWNNQNPSRNGVCSCGGLQRCNGKGDGSTLGKCKKVTIAIFQSGTIIITGANTETQLHDAHAFICSIFKKHQHLVQKKTLPPPLPQLTYVLSKTSQ
tara:strand:+ start:212 stop:1021 length:810 start_codon:yes stop_codon:yes gene_type:complete